MCGRGSDGDNDYSVTVTVTVTARSRGLAWKAGMIGVITLQQSAPSQMTSACETTRGPTWRWWIIRPSLSTPFLVVAKKNLPALP